MRMINDLNDVYCVDEILGLDGAPAWNEDRGSSEDNPEIFSVGAFWPTVNGNEHEYLGSYILDGKKKTYLEAVKNFNEICMNAAETGFFRLSDFKNFELY